MSLHPPTPIPVFCLRKQVNQTQKPVGCVKQAPALRSGLHSHQSFHLDFSGKPRTHTKKEITPKSEPTYCSSIAHLSADLSTTELAAAQPAAM